MATGMIDTWTGNPVDIGPIYPFVGSEILWLAFGVAIWILWHVWQIRFENRIYREEVERLKGETLARAIRGEIR